MDFFNKIELFLSDNISDIVFIQQAYQAILGRDPDPDGMNHYLSLLDADGDKMSILSSLRFSVEGKKRQKNIKQFDQAMTRYYQKKRSLIRRLILRLTGRKSKKLSIQSLLSAREQVIYLQFQELLHSDKE